MHTKYQQTATFLCNLEKRSHSFTCKCNTYTYKRTGTDTFIHMHTHNYKQDVNELFPATKCATNQAIVRKLATTQR